MKYYQTSIVSEQEQLTETVKAWFFDELGHLSEMPIIQDDKPFDDLLDIEAVVKVEFPAFVLDVDQFMLDVKYASQRALVDSGDYVANEYGVLFRA